MSLPVEWRKVGLEEVYWFQEGPGVRKWQFTNAGIKLLNVANIEKTGQLNLAKTDRHLSVEEVENRYQHFLIDEGDLVIASSGISFDEDGLLRTRGAFVESNHLPLCLNTSTIRFKPKSGTSDLTYLKHWLDSREFREQITKLVTGSAQQNFGPSHLKALRITLPPLPEQRRIAAILDQADALRAKRREALAQLDNLSESIFIEMFENQSGIQTVPLGRIASMKRGPFGGALKKEIFVPEGAMVYEQRNAIQDDCLTGRYFISDTKFREMDGFAVLPNDLIVSCSGTIGKVAIVPDDAPKGIINQALLRIRVDTSTSLPIYLKHALQSQEIQKRLTGLSHGTGLQNFPPMSEVKALEIPLPPIEMQHSFEHMIYSIEKLRKKVNSAAIELESLFASLQHRAFCGKL